MTATVSSSTPQTAPLKILVVGPPAVGKTSLITRYTQNIFEATYKVTIGVDFQRKIIKIDDTPVQVMLWDIAGQENSSSMTRTYYKDADGAFVVCDMSRKQTLDAEDAKGSQNNARRWKSDIDEKVQYPGSTPIPAILLANKCDVESQEITDELLVNKKEELGFLGYFKTSAKNNFGIQEAVESLVKEILIRKAKLSVAIPPPATTLNISVQSTHQQNCTC